MTTCIPFVALQAAIRRSGVYIYDVHGNMLYFYHKTCLIRNQ
jgi:hypothetical protein